MVFCRISRPGSAAEARRRWSRSGSLAVALIAVGCVFDLGELREVRVEDSGPSVGGSVPLGGSGGATAGAAGADPTGGSVNGGGGVDVIGPGCDPGEKRCADGRCLPIEPAFGCGDQGSCQACASPDRTELGCSDSGQCVVTACTPGFADCDGDTLAGSDLTASNGCEYSFGTVEGFSEPARAPFQVITLDGQREDWAGVSAQRMERPCSDCGDVVTPEILNENTRPSARDLDGYYRIAWDNDFFYLLAEVYDDSTFASGSGLVGQVDKCDFGAECEDSVMLLLDGRGNRSGGYGNDDHRLFFGLGSGIAFPSQGAPQAGDVSFVPRQNGTHCYAIEAQVDWEYLVGTQNAQGIDGQFPPADGQTYGFDVAVSDVDPSPTDPQEAQRQSLIFWRSPGVDYRFQTDGFGLLQLSGGG